LAERCGLRLGLNAGERWAITIWPGRASPHIRDAADGGTFAPPLEPDQSQCRVTRGDPNSKAKIVASLSPIHAERAETTTD
jgi:hypothetical protein